MPRRCARTVSAVAVRSRWSRISSSRPSSPDSNWILPARTSTAVSRSTGRATACSSPWRVARWRAAAAMVSAPAMANRALTPLRWSTALDSRSARAKRARISTRWSGTSATSVRLLADDRDLVGQLGRVVGADLGAEPVLQRRDDPAAVRVVLRVRAGHHEDVERQPQDVAADLDVALLHHVEHRDLDALGEVGQLVDRDDAAVAARDEAEVDRLGVTEGAALGHLHRVDVADEVGDARVRGRELLDVPLVAVPPGDREVVAELGGAPQARGRQRLVRVLADLRPVDDRGPLVEQADQGAQQAGLALAALAEQDDVVPGDEGPLELRDDGGLEAVDPRPRVAPLAQGGQEVVADLGPHGLLAGARRLGARRRLPLLGRITRPSVTPGPSGHRESRPASAGGVRKASRSTAAWWSTSAAGYRRSARLACGWSC